MRAAFCSERERECVSVHPENIDPEFHVYGVCCRSCSFYSYCYSSPIAAGWRKFFSRILIHKEKHHSFIRFVKLQNNFRLGRVKK